MCIGIERNNGQAHQLSTAFTRLHYTNALIYLRLENDGSVEREEALGHSYIFVVTLARRLAWVVLAAPYFMRANIIIAEGESVWALVVCHGTNTHGGLCYGVHNADGTTQKLPIEDLPGGPRD